MKTKTNVGVVQAAIIVVGAASFLLMPLAGSGAAKDENDLGMDRRSYVPGETVRASIDTVGSRQLPSNEEFLREYSGLPPAGQYVVSFRLSTARPEGERTAHIWVPADVTFIRRDDGKGLGFLESRLVFEVPALPSGHYVVRGCWTPCRRRSLVGRTEVSVGDTEREAALLARLAMVQSRARFVHDRGREFRDRWNRTKDRLDATGSELALAKPLIEDLENRVWVLEHRAERERLRASAETESQRPGMVLLLAGGLAGVAAASLLRRVPRIRESMRRGRLAQR